jgi:hypothetical protein
LESQRAREPAAHKANPHNSWATIPICEAVDQSHKPSAEDRYAKSEDDVAIPETLPIHEIPLAGDIAAANDES